MTDTPRGGARVSPPPPTDDPGRRAVSAAPATAASDADVIGRSLAEPAAFAAIFDRHWHAIHAYCNGRAGSAGEDVAAETFRIAFDERDRFDRRYADAAPWLYGVATNLLRRAFRDAARGRRAVERAAASDAADDALGPEEARQARPRARRGAPRPARAGARRAPPARVGRPVLRGGGARDRRRARHGRLPHPPRTPARARPPRHHDHGGSTVTHDHDLAWLAAQHPPPQRPTRTRPRTPARPCSRTPRHPGSPRCRRAPPPHVRASPSGAGCARRASSPSPGSPPPAPSPSPC